MSCVVECVVSGFGGLHMRVGQQLAAGISGTAKPQAALQASSPCSSASDHRTAPLAKRAHLLLQLQRVHLRLLVLQQPLQHLVLQLLALVGHAAGVRSRHRQGAQSVDSAGAQLVSWERASHFTHWVLMQAAATRKSRLPAPAQTPPQHPRGPTPQQPCAP